MGQLINRLVNAIMGFLIGAFKADHDKPLPPPPPFPVGTPPTPPPQPPSPPPSPTPTPPAAVVEALKWYNATFEFVKRWEGRFIPPKFGGSYQCVALVNEFTSEMWHVFWPRLSD